MMNIKLETELCLGLPGGAAKGDHQSVKINGKRGFSETVDLKLNLHQNDHPANLDLNQKLQTLLKDSVIKPPPKYVITFFQIFILRDFILFWFLVRKF